MHPLLESGTETLNMGPPAEYIVNMYTKILIRANLTNGYVVDDYRHGISYGLWVKHHLSLG